MSYHRCYRPSGNLRAQEEKESFVITVGMHKIYSNYKTIIGSYYNKNNREFDLFFNLDFKCPSCPSCDSKIFESSCYKCCHEEGCGKVNYFKFTWFSFEMKFYYNKVKETDPIRDSEIYFLKDIRKFGLTHHICSNCGYEFFTIYKP